MSNHTGLIIAMFTSGIDVKLLTSTSTSMTCQVDNKSRAAIVAPLNNYSSAEDSDGNMVFTYSP